MSATKLDKYFVCNDEDLFSLVQGGDNNAFDILYERFFPILYIHALKKTGNKQDAKDLVQDTFIALYSKKDSIGHIQNFSAYLYVLLKNNILNFWEKQNVRSKYLETTAFNESYSPVENYLFEKELKQQIESGVELLPKKMREIFELSRNQHLSNKNIGNQLNISDKTVKRQITNALKIIRNKLNFFL